MSDTAKTDAHSEMLHDLVAAALKAGADAAEAVTAERRSLSITVRMGELEEVEREESRDLGLRVFVGGRQVVARGRHAQQEAIGHRYLAVLAQLRESAP